MYYIAVLRVKCYTVHIKIESQLTDAEDMEKSNMLLTVTNNLYAVYPWNIA